MSIITFFEIIRSRTRFAWHDGIQRALMPQAWEKCRSEQELRRLESMVGPQGFWEKRQDFIFNFLLQAGLKPHHYFLDIGCGPLSGGLKIIPYLNSNRYVGLDIREQAISESHRQVAQANLAQKNPVLLVSETFGATEICGRIFDFVWASAIVYHLNDALVDKCFQKVEKYLGIDSIFYCNVNTLVSESQWQEFPFVQRSLAFYHEMGMRYGLEMRCLGELSEWGYPDEPGKTNHMLEFRKG